jgi:hypothetical protein
MEKLCFSVDTHSSDGYRVTKCVLLHIGKTILEFESSIELEKFADEIKAMISEIRQAEVERD